MSGDVERLAEVIRSVTDLWDEPLDEVHDVPPIVNAILASDWLAAHDAEVAARAWDEGYVAGHSNAMRRMSDEPDAPTSPNPYRVAGHTPTGNTSEKEREGTP